MDCKNCKCYYSCQYMQHRFNVKECEEHTEQVEKVFNKELIDREEMLKREKTIWKN